MSTPVSGDGSKDSPYVLDKEAKLDFSWKWDAWLTAVSDTILSQTVEPSEPAGLQFTGASITNAALRVSAFIDIGTGVVGAKYRVPCKIVTAAGRTDRRSIYIKIAER